MISARGRGAPGCCTSLHRGGGRYLSPKQPFMFIHEIIYLICFCRDQKMAFRVTPDHGTWHPPPAIDTSRHLRHDGVACHRSCRSSCDEALGQRAGGGAIGLVAVGPDRQSLLGRTSKAPARPSTPAETNRRRCLWRERLPRLVRR